MVLGAAVLVALLVASYYVVPTFFGPVSGPGLRAY